jgi:hypothetical protein
MIRILRNCEAEGKGEGEGDGEEAEGDRERLAEGVPGALSGDAPPSAASAARSIERRPSGASAGCATVPTVETDAAEDWRSGEPPGGAAGGRRRTTAETRRPAGAGAGGELVATGMRIAGCESTWGAGAFQLQLNERVDRAHQEV